MSQLAFDEGPMRVSKPTEQLPAASRLQGAAVELSFECCDGHSKSGLAPVQQGVSKQPNFFARIAKSSAKPRNSDRRRHRALSKQHLNALAGRT
ncbi:MAG TPA: hypothetical protein VFG30_43205 [Polyangiales bacterium]|nr:hypothetical protein [Polyangiales bacterium]